MKAYETRLQSFLRVLEVEENKVTAMNLVEKANGISLTGSEKSVLPLSQFVPESWEKQGSLLNHAARKGWTFDFIW